MLTEKVIKLCMTHSIAVQCFQTGDIHFGN